ncbi:LPS export ABC transporter periplasmic protein LptC [uncultured Arcticibacterium sp.]|uniref:LPS export ABC transporter periplasmic protein LptC n=1 Tax=uncultured Arcticibacterium sp. TaxID=2173042 RepID=UPI0030F8CCA8
MRFLLGLLLLGFLASCKEDGEPETPFVYLGPIMTVNDLAVAYSDSGKVVVKMSTAVQEKMQNEDENYPKAIYVNFLNDDAVEYSSLRGDSGRYVKSKDHYVIMGNVFFYNREEQQSLSTNELIWSPKTKKIYTDKKVQVNTPTDQLIGNGMESDQDFSNYKFIGGITGYFKVDSLITQPDTSQSRVLN